MLQSRGEERPAGKATSMDRLQAITRQQRPNHNALSSGPQDYKELLRLTIKDHEQQGSKKATYQLNPENRNTLWNMIERFKAEREERKDRQIAEKTANAAV